MPVFIVIKLSIYLGHPIDPYNRIDSIKSAMLSSHILSDDNVKPARLEDTFNNNSPNTLSTLWDYQNYSVLHRFYSLHRYIIIKVFY